MSGNPNGKAPSAGWAIADWFNHLQLRPEAEIEAIASDPKEPVNKRAAAVQWLQAASRERDKTGRPINGESIDRIQDRTAGKPIARHEHSGPDGGPIVQVQVQTDLADIGEAYQAFRRRDRT